MHGRQAGRRVLNNTLLTPAKAVAHLRGGGDDGGYEVVHAAVPNKEGQRQVGSRHLQRGGGREVGGQV